MSTAMRNTWSAGLSATMTWMSPLLLLLRLGERDLADHVDLAGEERVQPRGVVVDRDVLPLVDVGLPFLPVVGVLRAEAALADCERLEHEGPGADGVREVLGAVLDDDGVLLDEGVEEAGVRGLERNSSVRSSTFLTSRRLMFVTLAWETCLGSAISPNV